jgi:hypothetical protein
MNSFFAGILIPANENIPKASEDAILNGLVDGVFILAGIIGVISIIIAGFNFITSNGDAAKAKSARQRILNTVIGLMIVAIAFGLVRFVVMAITNG